MNRQNYDPSGIPNRWLNCPRKGSGFIVDKFLPFKVPLNTRYDSQVPLANRFSMSMLLDSVKKSFNAKLGLIIDLTNTDRFYDADREVKELGIKYFKLKCRGHGETPSTEHTRLFINIVETFIRQNPTQMIGVHCTHGFNRTGFLIVSYMVEKLDFSVDMAILLFAENRNPGIYKQDYINELFRRYADPSESIPAAPPLPDWDSENEPQPQTSAYASILNELNDDDFSDNDESKDDESDENEEDEASAQNDTEPSEGEGEGKRKLSSNVRKKRVGQKRQRANYLKINPIFAEPDLPGTEPCTDPDEIARIQQRNKQLCGWNGSNFPGSQPVSMDQNNIAFLKQIKYMVSWKADGTRYMMAIYGKDQVYMIDRDNSVFKIKNLQFPHRKDFERHLSNTLLDGEFVMDLDPITNKKIPRYLIYDIIQFEENAVGKMNFHIRMQCIDKEIIFARHEAMKNGRIDRSHEPFSVRQKQFYPLGETKKLLSKEFEKQITHGIDGLIFQPIDQPYTGGRCDYCLKWKPPSMNSVDFKLVITEVQEYGMLPQKVGQLWVTGYEHPFSSIKVTKKLRELDGKIIECRWLEEDGKGKWDFMRERLDKSYPNHITTATAVCGSIKFPITDQRLIDEIALILQPSSNSMRPQAPPPASRV